MPQYVIAERAWAVEHYFHSCGAGRNAGSSLKSVLVGFEEFQKPPPPKK